MRNLNLSIAFLTSATLLTACGGGGGSTPSSIVTQSSSSSVAPAPTLSFASSEQKVAINTTGSIAFTATNVTSCSEKTLGSVPIAGSLSVSPTVGGRVTYTVTCTGAGGSISKDILVATPIPVKKTSYENKNVDFHLDLDSFNAANGTLRTDGSMVSGEGISTSGLAYADFLQNGSMSVILNTARLLQYDSNGIPLTGKLIVLDNSTPIRKNITSTVIKGSTEGCVHVRKTLVADFNNDGKPDVFFSCHGDDIPTAPGETSRILLSQPDGTYVMSLVAGTENGYTHGASAADINGDGKIDLVLVDPTHHEHNLRVVLGNGDGTFTEDLTRLDPTTMLGHDAYWAGYYVCELITINNVIHLFASGDEDNGTTQTYPSDPSAIPTIDLPFNGGYADYTQLKKLPVSTANSVGFPEDFVMDTSGNLYTSNAKANGVEIKKFTNNFTSVSTIYSHTGIFSTKNPSTWLPFIEIFNNTIFDVDSGSGLSINVN